MSALRLIFWGGMLCAIDLPWRWVSDGWGWQLDPFNDAVGMVMVVVGVIRLGRIPVDPPWRDRYGSAMTAVKWFAVIGVADAALGHFVFARPPAVEIALAVGRMLQLAGVVLLCLCMRSLCAKAALPDVRRYWDIALGFLAGLVVIPTGYYYFGLYFWVMLGGRQRYDPPWLGVAHQVMLAVALLAMYLATSRMAAAGGDEATADGAQGRQ